MRRTLILAAAIAALAAMALPAGASAYTSNWTMERAPLEEEGTVTFTAHTEATGGSSCHTHIHATLEGGTGTGAITAYEATECVPTETLASICSEVTSVEPENLPWMLDDEGNSVRVTGIKITRHYSGGAFCPETMTIEDDTAEGGGVFITPENTEAMSSATVSGSVETSLGTEQLQGEGEVTEGSGTYGL